jgi:uncharacterized protein YhhL (DUF1145 family)
MRSHEQRFLAVVFLGGVALRLLWLFQIGGSITRTYGSAEGSRIALAVAQGHGIADAYYQGYGPTAHMMPASPAIAGFLLWLFGPGTPGSNIAFLAWCLLQVGVAVLLLRALFRSFGADPVVMRWGTALLALVTPFVTQETIDFRYWDGAAALCLAAANLLLISRFETRQEQPEWRDLAMIATLSALTLFVSPPVGFATGLCWTVFALRSFDFTRCLRLGALTGCALLLVFTPWAVRNNRTFGEPILMRSNFGLELAIANHPAALSDSPAEIVHARRIAQIHPYEASAGVPRLVKPAGEVAYSRALGQKTWGWIEANPGSFAILYLRHLREFFFPDNWEMEFSGWPQMAAARTMTMSLVDLFGLIGLGVGLFRRRRGYWIMGLFVTALSLPYGLFEPTTSHMYPTYCLLAFVAVEAVTNAARKLGGRLAEALGRHLEQAEVG